MASTLEVANQKYLEVWQNSVYSNVVMMRYIVGRIFLESSTPWDDFFTTCDLRVRTGIDQDQWWSRATELASAKKPIFFGPEKEKPVWDEIIPDNLWLGGNGLCTSFTIAVNEESGLKANYTNYETHRAAHKVNKETKSTTLIDSSAGYAFEMEEDEEVGTWQNQGKSAPIWVNRNGDIFWKNRTPKAVENSNEAMKICLNQLYKTARYGLVLYRKISCNKGIFAQKIQFSPLHRVFKLVTEPKDEECTVQYIESGAEKSNDMSACYKLLRMFNTGDESNPVFQEILEIFYAARMHWGYPSLSKIELIPDASALQSWPNPVY
ncbi:hypothetical protein P153DRAFT_391241 [Dothidotthia symphoricarpi CBS 119687]|uniref:Uncharacterized protein n=1 Tax=Dothidotthia symphoricarpi CBS 119687 TaxID=1392245 RepID=A0A6A5ZY39_9PLEO|nr:uncharacterized protein P153DRAFT_391241 [Dothidotthia symphoricarpi CBS 119687]KAF2123814.1 hypothetical protein P153DRAFT_391241 [Dothidotthia symphoricarpi CBS 119687]